jgi:serine/threonine protein kinase/WD40 repeat protein
VPLDNSDPQLTVPAPSPPTPPPATAAPESTPPTFPSEAEALLKNLRFGKPRVEAPPATETPAADAFPQIPNYEIECELGRGGMGVVYKARHTALHHTVAIKMILASAHASPGEVVRFLAEAEAVAAVKHPNVVQVYDLGNSDSRPYFVMEYVEGGNLASRLKSGGPLTPTAAAELIEAVARGMQAAHDAGIVHRDLKPANILIADSKPHDGGLPNPGACSSHPQSTIRNPQSLAPKVSDFGLAKRLSSDLTRSQAVMGTPAYMAPEQAGGKAKFVGPQADVYAMGVILYECLVGKVPFEGQDAWSLIRQVLEDPPQPVRKFAPHVPRDLELICLKCLEKEPHHRYPTAAALADDLVRFLRGEPVSVRPISIPTRLYRWAKKRPAPAALAALGILAALVVPPVTVGIQGRLDRRAAVAEEAQQKEAAAKRAEEEAQRARIAAERLADAQKLFGLQNELRSRAALRPLGWTTAIRADVSRAIPLARGDRKVIEDIRSISAGAFLAHDLFPLAPVAKGLRASAAATDPKTGLVALGEYKSWGSARILLVNAATGETVRTLTYPTVPVINDGLVQDGTRSLLFSPDGKHLFAGTRSSQVMRFDLDKPQNTPAMLWKAANTSAEQLALSPDGKILYTLCRPESRLLAWDVKTGKPQALAQPPEKPEFRSFTVLPSGELLAGDKYRLYRWKADRSAVSVVAAGRALRLAPVSGSLLLVSDGPRLGIHDRDSGELTNPFMDPNLRRATHEEDLRSIAIHPSRAFVATTSGDHDRTVKVWELASGRLIGTVTTPGTGPIVVAWSGDGVSLLASSEGYVSRWRFAPAESQRFACFAGPPLATATFLPDGRVAALGIFWNGQRELLTGKVGGSAEVAMFADRGGNSEPGLTVNPEGLLAITASRPGITRWKPGTPLPAPSFTREITWSPRFSPDGRALWAVVGSKTVRTYDPKTGKERAKWNNRLGDVVSGLSGLNALAVGRTAALAGGQDGSVYLLDLATCEPAPAFRGSGDPVLSVAFTPNDEFALAGTQNGKLRTIRLADKTELPATLAHPSGLTALAVNRANTLCATGGRDRTIRLWKRSGEKLELLFAVSDLPTAVKELQFNTAGQLLVLLDEEHAVRVWDINRLKTQLASLNLDW